MQAAAGYYRILGRIDDVINVAGHRLGTKEIESAALMVPKLAEAAMVPVTDVTNGKVPDIYVSLKPGTAPSKEIVNDVFAAVITEISPIGWPQYRELTIDAQVTADRWRLSHAARKGVCFATHERRHAAWGRAIPRTGICRFSLAASSSGIRRAGT